MTVRRRWVWLAVSPLLLAGCSTVADVEASHAQDLGVKQRDLTKAQQAMDELQRNYLDDLATAKEWDVHWLGIPASGWVAIIIVVGVCAMAAAGFGFWLLYIRGHEVRAQRLQMNLAKEKTRQRELEAQKAEYDSVQRYIPPAMSSQK